MMLGGLMHAPAVLATILLADVVVRHAPGGYALPRQPPCPRGRLRGYSMGAKVTSERYRPAFDTPAHHLAIVVAGTGWSARGRRHTRAAG
jgi:hypothetical protein